MSSNAPDNGSSSDFQISQYSMDVNIMRTALILFCVVIFVVVLLNVLHLYAKCVVRRRARHRTIRLVDIRFTDEHLNSREPPKNGLEPSVIAALPTFAYKSIDRVDETEAKECTVCLGTFEDEEMVKVLSNCKHMFHVECIDMWLNSNSTCPVCRTGAKPLEPTHDTEAPSDVNETGDAVVVPVDLPSEIVQDVVAQSIKEGESGGSISNRLSSFRRILSRKRLDKGNQQSGQSDGEEDLEKQ